MAKKNQYFPQSLPHPGKTLAEKLEEMGMGSKEFAIRTGKPEKTISAVLNGKSAITPDMAVQFESVTKIPAHFWMNSQRGYDEFVARKKYQQTLEEANKWAKNFPLAEMVKLGWIQKCANVQDKNAELLRFFGCADHQAWENYYFNQQLRVAFRISLAHTQGAYAISAWLRQGELQAEKMLVQPFVKKKLEEALVSIKTLMVQQPKDFFVKLQNICAEAGVKVVHTVCLPQAPINGATRWMNDTPLIQLSGRYKKNDIFWFTVFHEIAHILLHGKKDVFLEEVDYTGKEVEKEAEADQFAADYLLSKSEEQAILDAMRLNTYTLRRKGVTSDQLLDTTLASASTIRSFATKFHTHPACIIGRLQHKGLIPYSFGTEFIEKIEIET